MIDARAPVLAAVLNRSHAALSVALLICATPLAACGGNADSSGTPATADQQTGQPQPAAEGQVVRTVDIRIGGVPVTAEIADNDELRARGFMHRDSLAENHGMLFVYGTTQVRSFWMRNVPIPLDMAFIGANGVIFNILRMEPETDQNYSSQGPMMYALEMEADWFEANGVALGDRLEF